MAEEKKIGNEKSEPAASIGILCLMALLLSVLTIIVPIIITIVLRISRNNWFDAVFTVIIHGAIPWSSLLTVALILSILGLIIAFAKKKRGKAYGFVSLALSLPGPFALVGSLFFSALFSHFVENVAVPALSSFPTKYYGPTMQCDDFEIKIADANGEDLSKAAALKYYWSGDTKDTEIHFDGINGGETRISAIGFHESTSAGVNIYNNFSVVLPEDKRFSGYDPGERSAFEKYDPKDHLGEYGIEPGTKLIFDEIEFHVYVESDVRNVCVYSGDPRIPNYLALENDDGSITFYRYYLSFECSADNENVQSDGYGRIERKGGAKGASVYVERGIYSHDKKDDSYPCEMIYEKDL